MSFSQPALNNKPSPSDVVRAMRDAATALVVASAEDLDSVGVAIDRLEHATWLLARSEAESGSHPAVRAEIDRTGTVTRALLEEMLNERDRVGSELRRIDPRDRDDQLVFGSRIDLSS